MTAPKVVFSSAMKPSGTVELTDVNKVCGTEAWVLPSLVGQPPPGTEHIVTFFTGLEPFTKLGQIMTVRLWASMWLVVECNDTL